VEIFEKCTLKTVPIVHQSYFRMLIHPQSWKISINHYVILTCRSIYLVTTLPEHLSSRHLRPSLVHMLVARLSTGLRMLTRVNRTFPSLDLEQSSSAADLGFSSRLSSLTCDLHPDGRYITFSDLPRKEPDRRTPLGIRSLIFGCL
jgi:hypothetical protein